jgi:hypothetical protein
MNHPSIGSRERFEVKDLMIYLTGYAWNDVALRRSEVGL